MRFRAVINGLGSWGPAAFVAFFATGTVLLLPGAVLGLAGGLLFGPVWGTALSLAGGTMGAILAFVVARYLAGGSGGSAGGFSRSSKV